MDKIYAGIGVIVFLIIVFMADEIKKIKAQAEEEKQRILRDMEREKTSAYWDGYAAGKQSMVKDIADTLKDYK